MNRFFEEPFFMPGFGTEDMAMSNWQPKVDVYDDKDNIIIKAELPGVDKKGISIDLKDRILTLKGERSEEKEVKEERFYRKELSYGRFERSFTLPSNVKPEQVKADYKDGILRIEVQKPEHEKPKQITVH